MHIIAITSFCQPFPPGGGPFTPSTLTAYTVRMSGIIAEMVARRARRALDTRQVPDDILSRLFEAAVLAPSCNNNQSWRFLVMRSAEALSKGRAALSKGNAWAQKAPVLVCVYTRKQDDCMSSEGRDYALFDCGLAVENLLIQATAEGLIAHPFAGYDAAAVRTSFSLPQDSIPLVLVAVGYPGGDESVLSEKQRASEHAPRDRKPLSDVVTYA
jgi:glutaredoxin-dependent peroxiredoxin